ncbi:hypothetical protein QBC44DRAFT_369552 [Cladorrhinum sp. PSN332]|nr:hypothetical protein QBC44DRAFT_369552 [Cladorrhinum sp. PSN332]
MESYCGLPNCGHGKNECLAWMIIQKGNMFLLFKGEESQVRPQFDNSRRFCVMQNALVKCGIVLDSTVQEFMRLDTVFDYLEYEGERIMCLSPRVSATATEFNNYIEKLIATMTRDTRAFGDLKQFPNQRVALYPTKRALPGYSVPRDIAGFLGVTTHTVYANLWVNIQGEIKVWVRKTDATDHSFHHCFSGLELANDLGPREALQRIVKEHGHMHDVRGVAKPMGHIAFTTTRHDIARPDEYGSVEFGKVFIYDMAYLYSGFKFETGPYQLMSPSEVRKALFGLRFNPTSSLVMLDFLLRQKLLDGVSPQAIAKLTARMRYN